MTAEEKEQVKNLVRQGVPTKEIADLMFYHQQTVQALIRKCGLYKPKDYHVGVD